jgi:UDP-N-acetylglucosamine 2-epimerase (non-hydrolysing)
MSQRILTIVGTRPEIVKLSRIIPRFDGMFEHRWIHTGQNWSANLRDVHLTHLGVRAPDAQGSVTEGSAATQVGQMMSFVDGVLAEWPPDAVFVLGDTNSALTAYAARRRGIPVFHMEAGNRCFDDRTPEELNRRIVDHLSSVNLAYTEQARHHLLREGLRPDRVFVVGSPQREVIEHHLAEIVARRAAAHLGVSEGRYVLASLHREENVDDDARRTALLAALGDAAARLGMEVIFTAHPRTQALLAGGGVPTGVRVVDAPGVLDFLSLARTAHCVVSDSGTLTEEASILGFPAVTLRRWHERPEGMDVGAIAMAEPAGLVTAIQAVVDARRAEAPVPVAAYASTQVSWSVANIVASYAPVLKDDHRTVT